MNDYRGEKYIRFGEFPLGKSITKEMIEDVESCIIFEMQPTHNIYKKSSYTYNNKYQVSNRGYRGLMPREINTNNHL